jgi:hypothetical protein
MKNIFTVFVLLLLSISSYANTKIISEREVRLPIDLSSLKLKWSNVGYGQNHFVKIIIPELASETLLNHRNVGEDGPCLFTRDASHVGEVLQDNPEFTQATVKIILKKTTGVVGGVCLVNLVEYIETDIRGFLFEHTRISTLPSRVVGDCI